MSKGSASETRINVSMVFAADASPSPLRHPGAETAPAKAWGAGYEAVVTILTTLVCGCALTFIYDLIDNDQDTWLSR